MNLLRRVTVVLGLSVFTLSGVAFAEGEEEAAPAAEGGEAAPAEAAPGGEATPPAAESTEAAPEATATSAHAAGKIEAGAMVSIPKGPSDTGEWGIGNWVGVDVWANYNVNEQITAGIEVPLALIKPDVPGIKALGGFFARGSYAVNDMISAKLKTGLATPGAFAYSGFMFPAYGGDLKFGAIVGAGFSKMMGPLHLMVDPGIVFQLDSYMDGTELKAFTGFQIPVAVHYMVTPAVGVGLHTGLYSGGKFKPGAKDGGQLPLIAGAMYKISPQMYAGGAVGLGSVIVPDGAKASDTLYLGAFFGWSSM